ncbi:hypothetical protein ANO14919_143680 [Xylariales sp. No.14919]|nr:hypothetical protein ANO14919_143680 [Xylariales sp. No.14919]
MRPPHLDTINPKRYPERRIMKSGGQAHELAYDAEASSNRGEDGETRIHHLQRGIN